MEKIKQIIEIFQRFRNDLAPDSDFVQTEYAKEIAALYKDYFSKDFVEWKDWQTNLKNIRHYFKRNEYRFEGKDITLPELFQYWENNIKDKL